MAPRPVNPSPQSAGRVRLDLNQGGNHAAEPQGSLSKLKCITSFYYPV